MTARLPRPQQLLPVFFNPLLSPHPVSPFLIQLPSPHPVAPLKFSLPHPKRNQLKSLEMIRVLFQHEFKIRPVSALMCTVSMIPGDHSDKILAFRGPKNVRSGAWAGHGRTEPKNSTTENCIGCPKETNLQMAVSYYTVLLPYFVTFSPMLAIYRRQKFTSIANVRQQILST